ncbi:MAG: hypothetical protein ACRYFS_24595 [Janthinobacterium lividum]
MATWILAEGGPLLRIARIVRIDVIEIDADFYLEAWSDDRSDILTESLPDTVAQQALIELSRAMSFDRVSPIKMSDILDRAEEELGLKPMKGVTGPDGKPVYRTDEDFFSEG